MHFCLKTVRVSTLHAKVQLTELLVPIIIFLVKLKLFNIGCTDLHKSGLHLLDTILCSVHKTVYKVMHYFTPVDNSRAFTLCFSAHMCVSQLLHLGVSASTSCKV